MPAFAGIFFSWRSIYHSNFDQWLVVKDNLPTYAYNISVYQLKRLTDC